MWRSTLIVIAGVEVLIVLSITTFILCPTIHTRAHARTHTHAHAHAHAHTHRHTNTHTHTHVESYKICRIVREKKREGEKKITRRLKNRSHSGNICIHVAGSIHGNTTGNGNEQRRSRKISIYVTVNVRDR